LVGCHARRLVDGPRDPETNFLNPADTRVDKTDHDKVGSDYGG
jgi:hypothetical protein